MDLELRDKGYVLTGGTDGLGLALATALVAEGAHVAVCGRSDDRLDAARSQLGDRGLVVRADVTNSDELDAFYDEALRAFGRLDGVVNNAGRHASVAVADSTDDEWREDYELKVVAAVHLARRALPELAKTKGAVVNVLAIKGKAPDAGSTPTAASRAAGLAFTKAFAAEAAPLGVRVNAILIGLIKSGQWVRRAESMRLDLDEFYRVVAEHQKIPLGRFGEADDFANLACFLLSPRAGYLTGVGVNLDGGLSPLP